MEVQNFEKAKKLREKIKSKTPILQFFSQECPQLRDYKEHLMNFFTSCNNLGDAADRTRLGKLAYDCIKEKLENEIAELEKEFEEL